MTVSLSLPTCNSRVRKRLNEKLRTDTPCAYCLPDGLSSVSAIRQASIVTNITTSCGFRSVRVGKRNGARNAAGNRAAALGWIGLRGVGSSRAVAAIGLCIRRLHPNGHSQNAHACDDRQSGGEVSSKRGHLCLLPQSSSASRFTAGAAGFFILSQSGGAPGPVGGILALRQDSFKTHFASMGEDSRAVAFHVFVEAQAKAIFGQRTSKRGLAHFQGIAPEIVAVQFNEVEGVEEYAPVSSLVTDEIERGNAVVIAG